PVFLCAKGTRNELSCSATCGCRLNDHSIDADKACGGRSRGLGPALGASPCISALLEEAFERSKHHCSLITTQSKKN
ncbi:unnamed protein product, partial [Musa textilis]